MKPVLPGDVAAAARALLPVPRLTRSAMARRLIDEASAADRFCKTHAKAHRRWGNGTLMAAAYSHEMGRELSFDDPDYLDCQLCVIRALLKHVQPASHDVPAASVSRFGAKTASQKV